MLLDSKKIMLNRPSTYARGTNRKNLTNDNLRAKNVGAKVGGMELNQGWYRYKNLS